MARWLLKDNEDGYNKSAAVNYAKNLKGKLLVVHGTGDDNVHYQNTERLIDELVKHNKTFTMMAYPNRSHGIYEGPGTRLHLYSLLTSYLETFGRCIVSSGLEFFLSWRCKHYLSDS